MFSSQSNIRRRWPSDAQETLRLQLGHDGCWRLSSSWPTKTFGHLGHLGHLGRLGKTSRFLLAGAANAASLRRPALTSPPQVVSLCRTSGARPANSLLGDAGSFDFVVAVQRPAFPQRKRASPADSCLRPRLIFLPLVAIACTTRTAVSTRRGRRSVSYQTDSRVPRTLAITRRGPRSVSSAAAAYQSCSAHAVRGVNVRSTRTEMKE
jgi:hypothetical protein